MHENSLSKEEMSMILGIEVCDFKEIENSIIPDRMNLSALTAIAKRFQIDAIDMFLYEGAINTNLVFH
ncbi:MAG: hypothetical protein RR436_02485 [Clostridia bacterium]